MRLSLILASALFLFGQNLQAQGTFQRPGARVLADWEAQIAFFEASVDIPSASRLFEQELRAHQLSETFFGTKAEIKFLRDYQNRELILEMGKILEKSLRAFLQNQDYSEESVALVNLLGREFLETYAEVRASDEFEYWRSFMRKRATFWGFMISPGAIYLSYIGSDLVLGFGKVFDFMFYFAPKTLARWGYLSGLKATESLAKKTERIVLAEKCRERIKRIHEAREAEVRRFKRDFDRYLDRFIYRWKTSLGPSRLILYGVTGGLLGQSLFYYPIPMLTEISFEQQKKWDAQEQIMEDSLKNFFQDLQAR